MDYIINYFYSGGSVRDELSDVYSIIRDHAVALGQPVVLYATSPIFIFFLFLCAITTLDTRNHCLWFWQRVSSSINSMLLWQNMKKLGFGKLMQTKLRLKCSDGSENIYYS